VPEAIELAGMIVEGGRRSAERRDAEREAVKRQ
jgi:hypothetical protein